MPQDATPELTGDQGLGALVQEYLDAQYQVLVAGDRALHQGHREVIHATRVAARRYRTVLKDFGDLFDPAVALVLDQSLRWYAKVLGAVRDLQVGRTELARVTGRLPDNEQGHRAKQLLDRYLSQREVDAVDALNVALDSHRYQWVVDQLTSWHESPPQADDRGDEEVERYLKRARRRVERRLDEAADAGNPEDLVHEARKAAKRARYVAELSEPVLRRRARSAVAAMTDVQDTLGARQDQAVANGLLRDLAETYLRAPDSPAEVDPDDTTRESVELLTALMRDDD